MRREHEDGCSCVRWSKRPGRVIGTLVLALLCTVTRARAEVVWEMEFDGAQGLRVVTNHLETGANPLSYVIFRQTVLNITPGEITTPYRAESHRVVVLDESGQASTGLLGPYPQTAIDASIADRPKLPIFVEEPLARRAGVVEIPLSSIAGGRGWRWPSTGGATDVPLVTRVDPECALAVIQDHDGIAFIDIESAKTIGRHPFPSDTPAQVVFADCGRVAVALGGGMPQRSPSKVILVRYESGILIEEANFDASEGGYGVRLLASRTGEVFYFSGHDDRRHGTLNQIHRDTSGKWSVTRIDVGKRYIGECSAAGHRLSYTVGSECGVLAVADGVVSVDVRRDGLDRADANTAHPIMSSDGQTLIVQRPALGLVEFIEKSGVSTWESPRFRGKGIYTPRLVARRTAGHDYVLFQGAELIERQDDPSKSVSRGWAILYRLKRGTQREE